MSPRFVFSRKLALLAIPAMLLIVYLLGVPRDKHPVEPAKLSALIKQADKIVVFEGPQQNSPVLFSSVDPKDIAEFNDALTVVVPKGLFFCSCSGTPAIRLYRGDTELALITSHHGDSVRCSLWTSDADLRDPDKWLKWFDARNMPEPRKEFDDMAAGTKQAEISYARWLAAMPKSIRPLWVRAMQEGSASPDVKPFRAPLAKEFPDTRRRALELFTWYGSGDGPWSGYPAYEFAVEELLLDFATPDLVAAAQTDKLTEAQLEGAARLFGGSHFDVLQTLPLALKKKLLDHSLKNTNEANLGRAKKAFAQP